MATHLGVSKISESTQQLMNSEVRRLVQEGYDTARRILTEKRDHLEILANGLLEFETLSGEEIVNLLAGQRPIREDVPPMSSGSASGGTSVPSSSSHVEADVGGMAPSPARITHTL